MNITVNGENILFSGPATVAGLTDHLRLDARKIAVERNLAIVPKSLHHATPITDGDRLEIIHFVGGG